MRFLVLPMLVLLAAPAVAADYLGEVLAVSDGDTFTMESETGKVRVRICGIDAPERGHPGYGRATGVLSNLIEGKTVHCLQVGEGTVCDGRSKPTSRDRIVAQCFLDKLDIAEEMTKSGTVCDWPKFSGGRYKIGEATCSRK
jgi:endonuclease YncB( thermonuclease family)